MIRNQYILRHMVTKTALAYVQTLSLAREQAIKFSSSLTFTGAKDYFGIFHADFPEKPIEMYQKGKRLLPKKKELTVEPKIENKVV